MLTLLVVCYQELRCPECRVLVTIPIDELPCNILLMRILEGIKNSAHNNQMSTAASSSTPSAAVTTTDFSYILNLYNTPNATAKNSLNNLTISSTNGTPQHSNYNGVPNSSVAPSQSNNTCLPSKMLSSMTINSNSSRLSYPSTLPVVTESVPVILPSGITSPTGSGIYPTHSLLSGVAPNMPTNATLPLLPSNPFLDCSSPGVGSIRSASLCSSPVPFSCRAGGSAPLTPQLPPSVAPQPQSMTANNLVHFTTLTSSQVTQFRSSQPSNVRDSSQPSFRNSNSTSRNVVSSNNVSTQPMESARNLLQLQNSLSSTLLEPSVTNTIDKSIPSATMPRMSPQPLNSSLSCSGQSYLTSPIPLTTQSSLQSLLSADSNLHNEEHSVPNLPTQTSITNATNSALNSLTADLFDLTACSRSSSAGATCVISAVEQGDTNFSIETNVSSLPRAPLPLPIDQQPPPPFNSRIPSKPSVSIPCVLLPVK